MSTTFTTSQLVNPAGTMHSNGISPRNLWVSFCALLKCLRRAVSSFPFLVLSILLLRVFWSCSDAIADPDIWWHMLNAKQMIAMHSLLGPDSYSFTVSGTQWLDHQWLGELAYYVAFRAFGLHGLFVLFTLTLSAIVALLFAITFQISGDPLTSGLLTGMGSLLAMVGFGPRTQTFGWLCFTLIYVILLRFRSGKSAPMWAIPLLFCVWINFHGSWLAGLAVYGIFLVSGLIRNDIAGFCASPYGRKQVITLVTVGLACVASLLVNPYGFRLVAYPFDMMRKQGLMQSHVDEWAPINFSDGRGKLVLIVIGLIFAVSLVSRKRWRFDDALLTVFVLYCGLTHVRFLMFAGIVLPPILAGHLGKLSSYNSGSERRGVNVAMLAAVITLLIYMFPSEAKLWSDENRVFPARASQFLRLQNKSVRLFNRYEWGGYLEWMNPDQRTFIDSRTDIFEYNGVLQDYLNVVQFKDPLEILAKYRIEYVLDASGSPLCYLLSHTNGWRQIYRDKQASIFKRSR